MDYLFLLCELAVTFAGFTAVVAVFQSDEDPDESTLNKVRLQQMLEVSLLTVAAGLLPFLLVSFGLTEPHANRVAAVAMVPGFAVLMFVEVRRGFDPRVQQLPGYSAFVARLCAGLGIVCVGVWVLAGAGSANPEALYQVGVTALLTVAGITFYRTATTTLSTFR